VCSRWRRDVRTLVEALEWHADVHPDWVHASLLGDDPGTAAVPLTYAALRDRGRAIAAGLAASDIRPADAVAVMLPTSLDYFAAFAGVLLAGAIPVPLIPHSRAPEQRVWSQRSFSWVSRRSR